MIDPKMHHPHPPLNEHPALEGMNSRWYHLFKVCLSYRGHLARVTSLQGPVTQRDRGVGRDHFNQSIPPLGWLRLWPLFHGLNPASLPPPFHSPCLYGLYGPGKYLFVSLLSTWIILFKIHHHMGNTMIYQ